MEFKVIIDTNEATTEELEQAIKEALRVLDMPNGDSLFIDSLKVEYEG